MTPLAAALALASGFSLLSLRALVFSLLLRWLVAWLVTGYTGDDEARRWLLWLPLRDVLSAAIWLGGAVGRRIVWRGEAFDLLPDGHLEPVGEAVPPPRVRHTW